MSNHRTTTRDARISARIHPDSLAALDRLRSNLAAAGYKSSDGQAIEYALAYADIMQDRGVDVLNTVVRARGRIK